jgi:hypothetical protein
MTETGKNPARKRSFPRAEITRQQHDVTWRETRGKAASKRVRRRFVRKRDHARSP